MCKHILLILAAAVVAHFLPKQTVYTLQGVAHANKTIEWFPNYKDMTGMFFFEARGNHTLTYNNNKIIVAGHAFFHTRGHMPVIHCQTEQSVCKVVAHLIA